MSDIAKQNEAAAVSDEFIPYKGKGEHSVKTLEDIIENRNKQITNPEWRNRPFEVIEKSAYDALERKLAKAVEWIEQVKIGPAKTMAEPKAVWYSTHSDRVLKEIEAIK